MSSASQGAGGAGATITITGFTTCSYFARAKKALLGLSAIYADVKVEVIEHATKVAFQEWWFEFRSKINATHHSSSPAVWLGEDDFLGGCDATIAWIQQNYMAGSAVSKPPRIIHSNDVVVEGDGEGFDYDLIVMGGGSGGLACSKEAAVLGARVCVLDFVKPSWQGTTWGLGGTCVNVGCIPKKLMHTAAILGESMKDAIEYGWDVPEQVKHSWEKMVEGVQNHIGSLNFGYKVALRDKGVKYENAYGTFVDSHTIECTDRRGNKKKITGRRIVIAVGGRPKPLDVPGGELAISSDDIFSLTSPPGKTLVVGASYVALECAGFLTGLGFDTTVLVRSILLRGFDQQCAELIGNYMQEHGTKLVRPAVPKQLEKLDDGRIKATWENPETHEESSDVFDTVFVATGRVPEVHKLNIEAAGLITEKDGKFKTVGEQTNVPHIYAIGDVLSGKPELTPVAIMAGRLLARRLYGKSSEGMDYDRIPTTVFTPLEYGNCGLSEEDAIARFGEDNIEVYHSSFTPLEWTVAHHRPTNACYAKIIVNKKDGQRVVGFHILGPNAGEITQGWACALRLGATYDSFRSTVGIHPTASEEFTTLEITKSSGISADKAGC